MEKRQAIIINNVLEVSYDYSDEEGTDGKTDKE